MIRAAAVLLLLALAAQADAKHARHHHRRPVGCNIVTGGGVFFVSRPCDGRHEEMPAWRGQR